MGKEFERTQRISHFLHEELARLLQSTVRDPRVQEVNLTGVEVTRDLSHAKVFFTLMNDVSVEERAEVAAVLSKVSGFLRSELAKASTMRTVPRISFRFDESVGRGRDMETLLREVRTADEKLHTGDPGDASEPAD
ncbi:MAG: 30S ribosome-binding factor RbfA [Congregibacter sp.]|jgi:ribosome-binding factor A|nr:30S ribosome-binding factor RbfA [Congregibacter sp.]